MKLRSARFEIVPGDLWIGLFVKRRDRRRELRGLVYRRRELHVFAILIPMIPLHLTFSE